MLSPMSAHITYVSLYREEGGPLLGTATCEECGALSDRMPAYENETELRRIADRHAIQPKSGD